MRGKRHTHLVRNCPPQIQDQSTEVFHQQHKEDHLLKGGKLKMNSNSTGGLCAATKVKYLRYTQVRNFTD